VQLIDDGAGVTLAAASTLEPGLGVVGKNNVAAAAKVGAAIAERAKAKPASRRSISTAAVSFITAGSGRLPMPRAKVG
jgi:ribosomal protein L18